MVPVIMCNVKEMEYGKKYIVDIFGEVVYKGLLLIDGESVEIVREICENGTLATCMEIEDAIVHDMRKYIQKYDEIYVNSIAHNFKDVVREVLHNKRTDILVNVENNEIVEQDNQRTEINFSIELLNVCKFDFVFRGVYRKDVSAKKEEEIEIEHYAIIQKNVDVDVDTPEFSEFEQKVIDAVTNSISVAINKYKTDLEYVIVKEIKKKIKYIKENTNVCKRVYKSL